jgi:hypothetical protein
MVELEVLNKMNGHSEEDMEILVKCLEKYPYFEFAQQKLLEITIALGIQNPLEINLRKRKDFFSKISNKSRMKINDGSHTANKEVLLAAFLENYQIPRSPNHFISK